MRYRAILIDPDANPQRNEALQIMGDVYEDLERWSKFALSDAGPNASVEISEFTDVLIFRVSKPKAVAT